MSITRFATRAITAVASATLVLLAANVSHAQSPAPLSGFGNGVRTGLLQSDLMRRVPVTIVLSALPGSSTTPATVLRRKDLSPRDVIVLNPGATTSTHLGAAIMSLLVAREVGGDTAATDAVLRIRNPHLPTAWEGAKKAQLENMIERLNTAGRQQITGVGLVPAIEIYLLPRALSGRVRRASPGGP